MLGWHVPPWSQHCLQQKHGGGPRKWKGVPPKGRVVPHPDLGLPRLPAVLLLNLPCLGVFLSLSLDLSPLLGLWDRSLHEPTPSHVGLELGG